MICHNLNIICRYVRALAGDMGQCTKMDSAMALPLLWPLLALHVSQLSGQNSNNTHRHAEKVTEIAGVVVVDAAPYSRSDSEYIELRMCCANRKNMPGRRKLFSAHKAHIFQLKPTRATEMIVRIKTSNKH